MSKPLELRLDKHQSHVGFTVTTKEELTEDYAMALQAFEGYPPQGYGFYGYRSTRQADGSFITKWSCYGSCD